MNAVKTVWVALMMAASLLGCGGGGDSAPATPAPAADARNGDYIAFASNGQQYTVNVNFDAKTVSFANGGATVSTVFESVGTSTTNFRTAASSTIASGSNDGFRVMTDGLVGSIHLTSAEQISFIAARNFVTTVAEAAGTYNFLGRTTLGGVNTRIFQGRITPAGILNSCNSLAVDPITTCSPSITSTMTVSAGGFTVFDSVNTVTFRIAKMGAERVYLRADTIAGDSRFTVGVPDAATYAAGTFDGRDNENNVVSYSYDGSASATLGVTPSVGSSYSISAPVNNVPVTGLRGIMTTADGYFFSMRNGTLGIVFAARANSVHPGYVMLAPVR